MADASASERERDIRTVCTLALINSKHAHYLWSLKRLVKEDLLREGAPHHHRFGLLNDSAAGAQRADADSVDAVVIERCVRVCRGLAHLVSGLQFTSLAALTASACAQRSGTSPSSLVRCPTGHLWPTGARSYVARSLDLPLFSFTFSPLSVLLRSVAPQLALDRPPPPPVHYDSLDFVERAKLRWGGWAARGEVL
jgi:hypothetical protein